MALYKLEEFDSDYQDTFGGDDIKNYDVYSDIDDDKIGSVKNIMVDEAGRFRYFVVDTGFWVFGKQVLLPVGRSRIDSIDRRIYAVGLTKEQVEDLPEFSEDLKLDRDYEERVTGVYDNYPLERTPTQLGIAAAVMPSSMGNIDHDIYDYQQKPDLFEMNDRDHQSLKLYEERLIANKQRRKTGEVSIGKRVETQTQNVAVPIEKDRVVIERTTPANAGQPVPPGEKAFGSGETVRMNVYEEQPDIRKETVLREEVNVRKEVDRDTVNAQERIRREELDVDSEGRPIVDKNL
ncbi:MAG: DUF2382 domain-containing protein [Cyanosarcina radialis HA8281-LM2]|jgi:uncharacterized protein (TIGR02271 family)|nr:DUF2382 domain-containing protein [Cyanosarcina radialis HA8281-LM2]